MLKREGVDLRVYWYPNWDPKPPLDAKVVITEFFSLTHLEEAREILWRLFSLAIKNPNLQEEDSISNLAMWYEHFHDMLVANHLLCEQWEDAEKTENDKNLDK